jgi:hypothetical protein
MDSPPTHSDADSPPARGKRLSWRIPTSDDPRLLKLALAQVGLATVVAALVLLVAAPREWLGPALAGLIPLAVFMAYRRWHRYQQSLSGPDNVRIDAAGVHWVDGTGSERKFDKEEVAGFRVGREEDTWRQVPALTLYLSGGFESQPLELHPPATEDAVRQLFRESWQIVERPVERGLDYDRTINVYSECHEEHHEWHWEGTREDLAELFGLVGRAADELPPAPPGAKPAQWILRMQRREPARLRVQHAATTHFDHEVLGAPAALLRGLAASAAETLERLAASGDGKLDVRVGQRERWTFHLHVRVVQAAC